MRLATTASAFGLYAYGGRAPKHTVFERFNTIVLELFVKHDVDPTYVGIDGEGYPDKYEKFGSQAYNGLVNSHFREISSLTLVANPDGSNEPSYDGFATVSLGFIESTQEMTLCFAVNESYIQFASGAYDEAWQSFLDLYAWDFGFGFSDRVEKDPDLHILGADNGKLTADEQRALNAWYGALPEVRLQRLRGIYPYNFVSARQLANEVMEGLTLYQFIERRQDTSLTQLSGNGLYLWKIDDSVIDSVRAQLSEGTALISSR